MGEDPYFVLRGWRADFNKDYRVNIIDIAIVSRALDTRPSELRWYERADLNDDGIINCDDLLASWEDRLLQQFKQNIGSFSL